MWGKLTTDRNDFYPWVTIQHTNSFQLYISEEERTFLFPYFLKINEFWTDGDTTNIHLDLENENQYYSTISTYDSENNRTNYKIKCKDNDQFQIIHSITLHKLPIILTCNF